MNAATASPSTVAQRVWDLPVRVSHWLLVVCFFDAWLTREGDATRMWHMLFGYSLAFLIAFRIVWLRRHPLCAFRRLHQGAARGRRLRRRAGPRVLVDAHELWHDE